MIKLKKGGGDKMQLVVFQLISGLMTDVIRHVFGSIKKAWSETERAHKDEFMLSPVAVKGRSYRK